MKPPAKNPCGSCPYRRDSPSGLWSIGHYALLMEFDKETFDQPTSVFGCHQNNGHLCSGSVGTHDMDQNLGMRLAVRSGDVSEETMDACLNYVTEVPLFESGKEAALHGFRDMADPSERTRKIATKLVKKGAVYEEAFEDD